MSRPRIGRDVGVAILVILWVTAGVVLDHGASLAVQRIIGAATWALLIALLAGESSLVRVQVIAAVAIATIGEVFFSLGIELYTYRLGNLPSFVPPGHGVVYLAALTLGRSSLFTRGGTGLVRATLAVCLTWAAWGLLLSPRQDLFGAILALCFAGFVVAGQAPRVYAAAFIVTSWLELAGTAAGTWTWPATDPSGLFTFGNPPSGIAGGYCLLDCAALSLGTRLSAWWSASARRPAAAALAAE